MKFFENLSLRVKVIAAVVGATLTGILVSEIGAAALLGEGIVWSRLAVVEPVGVFVALAFGAGLAHLIAKPLSGAIDAIGRLRDGDYEGFDAKSAGGGAMLRDMATSISDLRERLLAAERNTKDAVRKSAAFDGATSALMMADEQMRITHINDSFRTLFKTYVEELAPSWVDRDVEDLIGQSMDVFHKNPAATRKYLEEVKSFPLDAEIVLPTDRVKLRVDTVRGEDGERLGFYIEWQATTQRNIQRGLLQGMQETQCVVTYDLDGRIADANAIFCEIVGKTKDEVVGRSIEEMTAPEERALEDFKGFVKKIRAGDTISRVMPRIGANGEIVWIQSRFNQIRDDNGRRMQVIEVGSDITEQQGNLNRRQATLDSINAGTAVIEFEPDGTVIRANKIFRQTMGYELHELVGSHHRMFTPDYIANSAEYSEHWRRLGAGETISGVFERVTKTGDAVYILGAYSSVKNDRGEVERVIKVATDITTSEIARRNSEAEASRAVKAAADTVKVLGGALSDLADGDLRHTLNNAFPDGYDQLRQDFNAALTALGEVVMNVVDRAESMKGGATEVSRAASDLSRRTERQAATLEETAASLKQLTDSLKESSRSSHEANGFTASAAEKASSGEDIMRRSLEAMRQIEDSSSQISTIIGVIDDIAFQTNLLALNAGVEAARAGDAGRGFAVVASEVRALAQRSAEAARDIKQLISTSSVHVSDGVGLASEAGEALQEIISDVQRIKDVVGDLAVSGKAQADNVSEIMAAMEQLDGVTQSNAAMVQEMTAASVDLTSEVSALSEQVSHSKRGVAAAGRKLRLRQPTGQRLRPSRQRRSRSPSAPQPSSRDRRR